MDSPRTPALAVFIALSCAASSGAQTRAAKTDPSDGSVHDLVLEFTVKDNGERFQALIGFLNSNKWDDGGLYTRFLQAAPAESKLRYLYWDHLNAIVLGRHGGKFDPDGKWIKGELSKMAPQDLYGVAMIEEAREAIVRKLGPGSGVGNWKQTTKQTYGKWLWLLGPVGVYTYCTAADGGTKCFERAETARDEIKKQIIPPNSPYHSSWDVATVMANPSTTSGAVADQWDNLKNWFNQHNIACASYQGPNGLIEIAIDPWDDKLVPAYTWWWWWDQPMWDALSKTSGDFCGRNYLTLHNAREAGFKRLAEETARMRQEKAAAGESKIKAILPAKSP